MRRIIMASITAVVVIAVLAGTLIPVLDDATATTDTFTNEGYFRMSESSDTVVIVWDPADPYTFTIDDVDISLSSLSTYSSYSVAFADDFILRFFNESPSSQKLQLWTSSYKAGSNSSSTSVATVTITTSGVTFNDGSTDTVIDHSGSFFVLDDAGDYIMKYSNDSAYVTSNSSMVYAGGISTVASSNFTGLYFEGTLDDYTFTSMNANVTISDVNSDYTSVNGYENLVLLQKITFTTTYSGTDTEQTYSYFLVPYEVTAERSVHFTDGENAILSAIPVMIIVALLLAVVAIVLRSRMD